MTQPLYRASASQLAASRFYGDEYVSTTSVRRERRLRFGMLFVILAVLVLSMAIFIIYHLIQHKRMLDERAASLEIDVSPKVPATSVIEATTIPIPEPVSEPEPEIVEEETEPVNIFEITDAEGLTHGPEWWAYFFRTTDLALLQTEYPDIKLLMDVPGLNIKYPVFQEKEVEKYYYLDHNRKGAAVIEGEIFTPKVPDDVDDAHLTFFGHHMAARNHMFANLTDWYNNQKAAEDAPYMWLYYPDRVECWKVWSTAHITVPDEVYLSPYILGSEAYDQMLNHLADISEYQVGRKPTKYSRTVTLSTCHTSHGGEDSRFAVTFVPVLCYYPETEEFTIAPKGDSVIQTN